MLLCRLTPPMCLNFLGLIHMDSHIIKKRISETYYTQIMGHMDVLGIISNGFNIYFPMCMLAFCLATWFSLGSRALNAMGFQQFMLNEILADDFIQEGKELIEREKRRRKRSEETQSRRREHQLALRGSSASKYRSGGGSNNNTNGRRMESMRVPSDGLLDGGDSFDYSTNRNNDFTDEINDRFGDSTQVTIGFKGYNYVGSDSDNENNRRNMSSGPPRGLFDDV